MYVQDALRSASLAVEEGLRGGLSREELLERAKSALEHVRVVRSRLPDSSMEDAESRAWAQASATLRGQREAEGALEEAWRGVEVAVASGVLLSGVRFVTSGGGDGGSGGGGGGEVELKGMEGAGWVGIGLARSLMRLSGVFGWSIRASHGLKALEYDSLSNWKGVGVVSPRRSSPKSSVRSHRPRSQSFDSNSSHLGLDGLDEEDEDDDALLAGLGLLEVGEEGGGGELGDGDSGGDGEGVLRVGIGGVDGVVVRVLVEESGRVLGVKVTRTRDEGVGEEKKVDFLVAVGGKEEEEVGDGGGDGDEEEEGEGEFGMEEVREVMERMIGVGLWRVSVAEARERGIVPPPPPLPKTTMEGEEDVFVSEGGKWVVRRRGVEGSGEEGVGVVVGRKEEEAMEFARMLHLIALAATSRKALQEVWGLGKWGEEKSGGGGERGEVCVFGVKQGVRKIGGIAGDATLAPILPLPTPQTFTPPSPSHFPFSTLSHSHILLPSLSPTHIRPRFTITTTPTTTTLSLSLPHISIDTTAFSTLHTTLSSLPNPPPCTHRLLHPSSSLTPTTLPPPPPPSTSSSSSAAASSAASTSTSTSTSTSSTPTFSRSLFVHHFQLQDWEDGGMGKCVRLSPAYEQRWVVKEERELSCGVEVPLVCFKTHKKRSKAPTDAFHAVIKERSSSALSNLIPFLLPTHFLRSLSSPSLQTIAIHQPSPLPPLPTPTPTIHATILPSSIQLTTPLHPNLQVIVEATPDRSLHVTTKDSSGKPTHIPSISTETLLQAGGSLVALADALLHVQE